MKTKLRTGIPEEDLFLLKIKYGNGSVSISDIHVSDYKYFRKLRDMQVYNRPELITSQMAELLDFDSFSGGLWDLILRKVPALSEFCDWGKLDGWDWTYLLQEQPQFAEHCDWDKLRGVDWARLLRVQPQFAEHCDWDKLDGRDWAYLLRRQPQLVKFSTVAVLR